MSKLTGGCLCGQVRYAAPGDPIFQAVCHCRNCQKQAGSAFSVIVGAPMAALTLTGELSTYDDQGETGGVVHRRFCPKCGSPVLSEAATAPGLALIKAGTLDDPTWLDPKMHVWCASAQPWSPIPDDAMRFEGNPA
jgi:hypothetical protein